MKYMDLDAIDKKILYYLSINARLSYSVLSSNVRISRESVKNRMEKMKKNNTILNFTSITNSTYLGLNFYTVYLNFNQMDASIVKKFEKYIHNHDNVIWANKCLGKWNYTMLLLVKDSNDLAENLGELKENFRELIKEIDFEKVLYEYKFSSNVPSFFKEINVKPLKVSKEGSSLYSLLDNKITAIKKKYEPVTIDNTDVKIIELLSENCRIPLNEMSKKLSLPIENIRYKMKRLAKKKILATFWATINYGLYGFHWYRIRIRTYKIDEETDKELKKYIVNNPNIFWGARILGQTDIHIDTRLKDNNKLNVFLENFKKKFEKIIIDYDTIIMLNEPNYCDFTKKLYELSI